MLKFSGKLMQEKLKIGWCLDDFLSYLNVSEKEFFEYLEKNFSNKAFSQMSKRLKTNEKRKSRLNKPHSNLSDKKKPETESISIAHVDSLEAQEHSLVESICQKEKKHNQLVQERNRLKQIFQEQRAQLIALTQQLENKKKIVYTTYEDWQRIASEMQSLTASISHETDLLEGIREEIEAHKKVSLFVYENGEIECENKELAFETDLAEESQLFSALVQKEIVESLTIKTIRQLSKVILLIKLIKGKGLKYEITFENEKVQKVFEETI